MITLAIATTGLSPEQDHILAIASAGSYTGYRIYQCPGPIPARSTAHHKITKAMSDWGSPASQILVDVQGLVAEADRAGEPLVMFNAAWVWGFFQTLADRAGMILQAPVAGVVDLQVLDQQLTGSKTRRPLAQVLKTLGWQGGRIPTDPVGISQVLTGVGQAVAAADALAGKDLAFESARAYYAQEEESRAYRAANSLSYRQILPYPTPALALVA